MKNIYTPRDISEWQQFIFLVKLAVEEDKLENLLEMLFTTDERNSFGLRVQIINALLNTDLPQREIQQQLRTSAATITRGSNMLKVVNPDIREWVSKKLNGKA
ncbi:Trp operon repressor [Vespertiliibacter pulmonis]|uniref:Trp operon repressor homolog n=1 Tax=Vespertiliibacter pulmonis TaxID=1443036 RepID=A0A3N4VS47_9PAST|nr:trp operon repressor [Vespertiliibacter pulmonis]QLB21506.1 Trp operon repressor [Vespertiliibacter pulmonis]RPE85922.1 Trp operon repressor [Vespertiliibacter pulmonis]